MRFSKWILAFFVCPVLSCWLAASTPVTVTNPNDDGSSGELRWAIQQANAGAADTIKFNLTYPATITLSQGVITISANVTIVGPGSANLTINGGGTQIFDINGSPGPNVSISGLAFSGGTAYAGGAIHAENGTLTINNCTFSGNYAQFGGALYAEYSVTAWTISNTAFSGNCATGSRVFATGISTSTNRRKNCWSRKLCETGSPGTSPPMPKDFVPVARPFLGQEEVSAAGRAILSGWVTQGPEVAAFEREFAEFVGTPHACAVSSCTTALHLALLAAGVRPGDEVITVSHSYIATANSVRYCGATPVARDRCCSDVQRRSQSGSLS
jgi:predicted outer membrane repeat protein